MAHSKACAILLRCADYFFILVGAWCCASCGTLTNGGKTHSFPSGHASAAFVHAGLAGQNIALLNVNHTNKRTLQAGVDLAAIGTGWARV